MSIRPLTIAIIVVVIIIIVVVIILATRKKPSQSLREGFGCYGDWLGLWKNAENSSILIEPNVSPYIGCQVKITWSVEYYGNAYVATRYGSVDGNRLTFDLNTGQTLRLLLINRNLAEDQTSGSNIKLDRVVPK